jgi:putative endonuclease
MFITYILFSEILQKFYIGFTSDDVNIRLYKHLASKKGFTAKAKDWKIVYTEQFTTKKEAMVREKQLKNWKSNKRITELILRSSTE